jgi:hypothetical protein
MALDHNAPHNPNAQPPETPPGTGLYTPHLESQRERKFDNYTILPYEYRVADDAAYSVRVFRPRRSEQFDRTVTYTTPWLTDIDGFNMIVGKRLASLGMNVVAVSPEHPSLSRSVRNLGRVTLRADAQVQHKVLDSISKNGILDTSSVIVAGFSRGAMVGFGVNSLAETFGRTIEYTDAIDPCLAKKTTPKDVEWPKIPSYFIGEVGALVSSMVHHPPEDMRGIAKNIVPLSPAFLVQQAATGMALFTGEAGTFIREWPQHTTAHVTLYSGSEFNHMKEWVRLLSPYPNVSAHIEDGRHFSGADSRVIDAAVGRILHAQRVLAYGGTGADITRELTYPDQIKAVRF